MADPTPAAPAAQHDPNVNVDGRLEPLSRVVAGFKQLSVAEQSAMAQSKRAQALEAQLQQAIPNANAYANLQALVAKDPQAAKEQFDRILRMASGVPESAQANTGAASDAKMALRMQELEQRLGSIMATEAGRQQVSEIRASLDEYPVFKNSPEARRLAETFTASLRAQNPDMPIKDAVSAVHTDLQKLLNGQTASIVQSKQELVASGGAPPSAAAATPGITEPTKLDRNSFKNGAARGLLEKALRASISGSNGATT